MDSTQATIVPMYAAFNRRDIDGVLSYMSESVDWPTASEGGRVVGTDAIRAYWTRQWAEYDPRVEPLEIAARKDGRTGVRVHQLVKTLGGEVLSDQEVWHTYTLVDGLIQRMDMEEKEPSFTRPHV